MPTPAPIVFVVDDDVSVRESLEVLIRDAGWRPEVYASAQLATMQNLVCYWATDYDWRKVEARLNALPQFVTEIDGLEIQFAHVRSRHADALPLIITHGWPGSIIELLKVVGPLTDPTAFRSLRTS